MAADRARFCWTAKYEGEIEGWTVKFVSNNFWRVPSFWDLEDLFQEVKYLFLVCKDKYRYVVEPKHFMALYKRCVINLFNVLSNKKTKEAETSLFSDFEVDGEYNDLSDKLSLDRWLGRCLLKDDPVIFAIISGIEKGEVPRSRPEGGRETSSEYFSRLAGVIPDDLDIGKYLEEALLDA